MVLQRHVAHDQKDSQLDSAREKITKNILWFLTSGIGCLNQVRRERCIRFRIIYLMPLSILSAVVEFHLKLGGLAFLQISFIALNKVISENMLSFRPFLLGLRSL